jgi:hypothetical protein
MKKENDFEVRVEYDYEVTEENVVEDCETIKKFAQQDMIKIKELEAEKNCLFQEIHEQRRLNESYRNTIETYERVIKKLLDNTGW